MKNLDPGNSVPEQHTGVQKDFEESVEARDWKTAIDLFMESKKRLLDINNWDKLSGSLSARFKLTDENGKEIHRHVKTGDFIKINIPAPGPEDNSDWVRVEAVEENKDPDGMKESIVIRVRPSYNPENPDSIIDHFFSEEATSNFIVQRDQTQVLVGIYGRNEKPNFESSDFPGKIRNTIVALGAILGLAHIQWRNLLLGVIGKK
jgi:hypothetical protein